MRLLTYNIRDGGKGRTEALARVLDHCRADLVVLQEAGRPDVVAALAKATGMAAWGSRPRHSLGFLSRQPVADHKWHRPAGSRRAFLELLPRQGGPRVYGIHLTAVHSNWTERLRVRELRVVLRQAARHADEFHVIAGDHNTLAPGEALDLRKLPARLRAVAWVTGRRIRWQTIQVMLDAGYVDGYRSLNSLDPGYTFPTWDPHVRLDYAFLPLAWSRRLIACTVVADHPAAAGASDHLPLLAELDTAS